MSPELLACGIEYKKRLWAKTTGRQLRCIVLQRTPLDLTDQTILNPEDDWCLPAHLALPSQDKLISHLQYLKKYGFILETRHQIIYNLFHHWSVLDCQLSKGKYSFFIVDAANSDTCILFTIATIRHIFPAAEIAILHAFVQKDNVNCAMFAFDHACSLAKIDNLHEMIHARYPQNNRLPSTAGAADYRQYADNIFSITNRFLIDPTFSMPEALTAVIQLGIITTRLIQIYYQQTPDCTWFDNVRYVHTHFPDEFALLFRNMQSYTLSSELKGSNSSMFTYQVSRLRKHSLEKHLEECKGGDINKSIQYRTREFYLNVFELLIEIDDVTFESIIHNAHIFS
jgi:hypothetical protein